MPMPRYLTLPTTRQSLGELSKEQLASRRDIIPTGFKSERVLSLPRDDTGPPHYSWISDTKEETNVDRIRLRRVQPAPLECTVQFETRYTTVIQYSVRLKLSTLEESFWRDSATAAFDAFREREKLLTRSKVSGPYLFGFPCQAVQTHLHALRTTVQQLSKLDPVSKKLRGAMKKVTLKSVAQTWIETHREGQIKPLSDKEA